MWRFRCIVRFYRVRRVLQRLEDSFELQGYVAITRLILSLGVLVHWITCLWLMLGMMASTKHAYGHRPPIMSTIEDVSESRRDSSVLLPEDMEEVSTQPNIPEAEEDTLEAALEFYKQQAASRRASEKKLADELEASKEASK